MPEKRKSRKRIKAHPKKRPNGDSPPFHSLIRKLIHHQKATLFILTFITSIIVLSPYMNYHGLIAPGDHGRDFYAYEQTMNGKVPYLDYWWVYGPVMPYYYATFLRILGVNIVTILVGKILLKIVAGLSFYFGLRAIIHPAFAYLASSWFLVFHQDFFFTHNHAGGIMLIVGCACCLLHYIREENVLYLWWGLIFALTLAFVKVNFGYAALVILALSTFIIDLTRKQKPTRSKKLFYILAIFALPLLIIGIYWLIIRGLPIYEIRQVFPYLEADHPYNVSLWNALQQFAQKQWEYATSNWASIAFSTLIISSTIRTLYLLIAKKLDPSKERMIGLSLIVLSIFYIANLHEFLKSGVSYRTIWSEPLGMMLSFIVIYTATFTWPNRWRTCLWISIFCLISWGFYSNMVTVREVKKANRYLSHPRAKVYLANRDRWIKTVDETTDFLSRTLKEDELFFALPYDPLYYYLTHKESPTRQLIFFDHINIPEEQERKIISELEQKNVAYILISSRQNSDEHGLGVFGQTYCPLIAQYIDANFEPIAQFGDWQNPPGWAWNHGTVIFKRRQSTLPLHRPALSPHA
ncbi:hypothetical protein MYX82_10595, partial [Acidobacteria bacterium AH-259-D05]|nr:hypothetical protein [Acidobacteria bacterium AH-259-D05]